MGEMLLAGQDHRAANRGVLGQHVAHLPDLRRWPPGPPPLSRCWTPAAQRGEPAPADAAPARLGASLSLLFIVTEALVGAGLVLFSWVAQNASLGRVISTAVHLVNTFFLLAALTLTAWWGSGGERLRLRTAQRSQSGAGG